jgi:hypothetical protein
MYGTTRSQGYRSCVCHEFRERDSSAILNSLLIYNNHIYYDQGMNSNIPH